MSGIDSFAKKKTIYKDDSYIDELPTFSEFPPDIELKDLNGPTLDFRLRQKGLPKMVRATVVRVVGNTEYQRSNTPGGDLYHVTMGDVRNATVEQLAQLQGCGLRSAQILKKLVG